MKWWWHERDHKLREVELSQMSWDSSDPAVCKSRRCVSVWVEIYFLHQQLHNSAVFSQIPPAILHVFVLFVAFRLICNKTVFSVCLVVKLTQSQFGIIVSTLTSSLWGSLLVSVDVVLQASVCNAGFRVHDIVSKYGLCVRLTDYTLVTNQS